MCSSRQAQAKEEIIIAQSGNSGGQTLGIEQAMTHQNYLLIGLLVLIFLIFIFYLYERRQRRWRQKVQRAALGATAMSMEKLDG